MRCFYQQGMALFLSCCLLLVGVGDGLAYQVDPSSQPPQAAQQSPDQLQQLVAPIALYPDALIAQILPAATYPDEIVEAAKWMERYRIFWEHSLDRLDAHLRQMQGEDRKSGQRHK